MAKKTSPKVSEARKALDDIIALAAGSGVRLGTESTFRTAGLTFTREQGGVIGVHEKGAVYMNRIPPSAAQALAAWLQRACDADPHDSSGPK
jgi:predicted nucleotidyltransferase